jgi:hypothetical protein
LSDNALRISSIDTFSFFNFIHWNLTSARLSSLTTLLS